MQIASFVRTHTARQVKSRFAGLTKKQNCTDNTENNTGPWTADKDQLFYQGLERFGIGKWVEIAALVRTRTNAQVLVHASTVVVPGMNTGSWSTDEDLVGSRREKLRDVRWWIRSLR